MFDRSILTEETRIEGVNGEFNRALHMQLEVGYLQVRQHESKIDPLFVGHYEIEARNVLASLDSWSEGHAWNRPKLRTLAIAIDALDCRNFEAELTSYQETNV
jgi:hypothetical protein